MKKQNLIVVAAALFLVGTFFVATVEADKIVVSTNGLTDEEEQGILFMREEEKLARDVYLFFYDMYDSIPIFNNIAQSEQRHMDAIKKLINRYGLEDPTEGNGEGEFKDPILQELYNNLISQGSTLTAALEVGAEIEEIDIIDLKEYMSQTDKLDILNVYGNLLKGSENHLRAFVKELDNNGVTYTSKYLSQEEFDNIIDEEGVGKKAPQNWQNRISEKIQEAMNRIQSRLRELLGEKSLFRNRFGR